MAAAILRRSAVVIFELVVSKYISVAFFRNIYGVRAIFRNLLYDKIIYNSKTAFCIS